MNKARRKGVSPPVSFLLFISVCLVFFFIINFSLSSSSRILCRRFRAWVPPGQDVVTCVFTPLPPSMVIRLQRCMIMSTHTPGTTFLGFSRPEGSASPLHYRFSPNFSSSPSGVSSRKLIAGAFFVCLHASWVRTNIPVCGGVCSCHAWYGKQGRARSRA